VYNNMLGASFLPSRLRGSDSTTPAGRPSWYNRQVTSLLQSLSRRACTHPIHTICFIALLASTSYVGLLEGTLFNGDASAETPLGRADFNTLLAGSKRLRVGAETGWKWQPEDNGSFSTTGEVSIYKPFHAPFVLCSQSLLRRPMISLW